MRFSPALREALAAARAGTIGEPSLLSAQLGFANEPDPSSRLFSIPGGGALLDLGVYPLSLAHALFGRPARVASRAMLGATGVDEQVVATLEYRGGAQAAIAVSLRSPLANDASVHGTRGLIRIHAPLYFPRRYEVIPVEPARPRTGAPPPPGARARLRRNPLAQAVADGIRSLRPRGVVRRVAGAGYGLEAVEVMRCLAEGLSESPAMPLDETIAVLETADAIRARWADPA